MALKPRQPDKNNPADVERYKKDMESFENNPTAWGVSPSVISQQMQNIKDKKAESEKPKLRRRKKQ